MPPAEAVHLESASIERGVTARWRLRTAGSSQVVQPLAQELSKELNVPSVVARVLAARGWDDIEAARLHMDAPFASLSEPSEMAGVDRAAQRILDALDAGEQTVIWGDYDVDGLTSTAILVRMIEHLRPGLPQGQLRTHIPHRIDEGYGLNDDSLLEIIGQGAKLIVTVDCGITGTQQAALAKQHNVDLIITDHHNLPTEGEPLPDAYALVHPRLPGEEAPFGELCGAGVAFKLAWRLATLAQGREKVSPQTRTLMLELASLAALATVADIVPLVSENRVLVKHALPRISKVRFAGVRALVRVSDLWDKPIDVEAAGFRLGPRLNAPGRMGHAVRGLELLLTDDDNRAAELAKELDTMNRKRQEAERATAKQAMALVEEKSLQDAGAIVLAHEDWHPGLVGIVCSRLVRAYNRPAVLMQQSNGTCAGSGRSIEGYSLHAGLSASSALLERFGGHDMAAGLSLSSENLDQFAKELAAHAQSCITEDMRIPAVDIDAQVRLSELTPQAVAQLDRLGPFGKDSDPPRLVVRSVRQVQPPKPLGAKGKHVALAVSDESGVTMRVVCWGWGDKIDQLRGAKHLDLVIEPAINTWNGTSRVEPVLSDLKIV